MSTQPIDGTELPSDLVAKPLALVGITGLDTINNAIHKSIWDAFGNNRRPDRAPIHFKLLSNAHEFPIIKPKRNSYEWYIPKGILKKNWLNKHLNLIPAVIVVYYDMDWNDPQWNEKIIECASRVQSMRAATEGHSPRLVVVIVQTNAPLPPAEDVLGAERAQALCAACEIQSKSLFVLPHDDHLMGYAIRLENAFYDLAQNYYHHEARNIKSHRDHLNKTTHQYLFVRHQFKMGFINELKQDNSTAHKHYLHAYNNLLEVRIVDTNALEVKTVAGYINYKLCRLLFNLSLPRDAIAQLRAHIERYRIRVGLQELGFEHHAWMARQYSVFGELFDEAIRSGLPAIQTQHPGFYYQQAAQCATHRRQACQQLCHPTSAYPQPDPLQGTIEFYGQRVWRPGKLSADPPDPQREQDAITALQYIELHHVNHSMIIISLLGSAIAQFKTYRCPRMRRHLLVKMANEYYTCADYGKALTLLTHMLYDYRKEKWWYFVSIILDKALACAYLSANIQDYVILSIEALGKNIAVHDGNKKRILDNLLTVLNCQIPQPEPNIPETSLAAAEELWKQSINKDPKSISVDMSTLCSCIEAKARFTQSKYQVDNSVTIELFVRVSAPSHVQLDRLSVCVNNPRYSCEFAVCEREPSSPTLLFEDGQIRKFLCQFVPDPQDVGRDLQIASISLQLGNSEGRHAILSFTGAAGPVSGIYPEIFNYRATQKAIPDFDSIQPLATAQIIPRESKMSVVVEQADPALQGEWFPITINLINDESMDAQDIQLSLNLATSADATNVETNTELCFDPSSEPSPLPLLINVGALKTESKYQKVFYLRSNKTISSTVLMKITYITMTTNKLTSVSSVIMENKSATGELASDKKMACFKEHPIKVTVVKPFEVSTKFCTMHFDDLEQCFFDDPFIVMPQIKVLSPWPILIEKTVFDIAENFEAVDKDAKSCLNGITVEEHMIANEAICIKGISLADHNGKGTGSYTVFWKRKSSDLAVPSQTTFYLDAPRVSHSWLRVEAIFPPHGWLRCPLPFTLRLHSSAHCPHNLLLKVEASDAFMFAGHKQCTVSILPDCSQELKFNFYPLICGAVNPPKFRLSPAETSSTTPLQFAPEMTSEYLQELIDRNLPSQIYIMPQETDKKLMEMKFSALNISA